MLHLKNEIFSRDPKVVQEMNEDPLIAHETQPTQTLAEMVRADERLKKEFPLITLPVLILHGTDDKATKPSGSKRFYEMFTQTLFLSLERNRRADSKRAASSSSVYKRQVCQRSPGPSSISKLNRPLSYAALLDDRAVEIATALAKSRLR